MNEVIISLENVGVNYRKRKSFFRHDYHEALKDITFDVRRGETLGVIGRNGAGKSTLLKVLSGIYQPSSGQISNLSTKTSLLTLQAGFDPNLCGRDNAVLSGMLLGYEKEVIYEKMQEIADYSELGDFFNQPIKTYSTGMKARLGFAVATYLRSEVLLIDEVLGVGDAKFKQKASETMRAMMKSDQTVVLVSHSADALAKLCDRVVWIENGVVEASGEALAVLEQYKTAMHKKK